MSYKVMDKNNKVVMKDIKTKEDAIKICMGLTGGGTVTEPGTIYAVEVFSNK